jgi:signal transduction histidine kinase
MSILFIRRFIRTNIILLLWIVTDIKCAIGQTPYADSLEQSLTHYTQRDTSRIKVLIKLSDELSTINPSVSLQRIEEAVAIADEIQMPTFILRTRGMLGLILLENDQTDKAMIALLSAKEIADSGMGKLEAIDREEVLLNLARAAYTFSPTMSIFYLKQALDVIEQEKMPPIYAGIVYNNLGLIYNEELNKVDSSLLYYEKAISCYLMAKDAKYQVALAQTNSADLYRQKRDLDKALQLLQIAKSEMSSSTDLPHQSNWYNIMAMTLLDKNNTQAALVSNRKAITALRKYENGYLYLGAIYENHAQIFEQMGFMDSAYYYQRLSTESLIITSKTEKKQLAAEIEAKYRIKQKEQQNYLLEVKNAEITAEKWLYFFALVSSILFLLISASAYWLLEKRNRQIVLHRAELSEFNEKLSDALTQVNILTSEKRRIISLIAHDLRTPLQSIQIKTEVLGAQIGSNNAHLERIKAAAAQILKMIMRIVEIENQDELVIDNSLAPTTLKPVIEKVLQRFEPIASVKNLKLELATGPSIPNALAAPLYLENILGNIISNAIKFSPPSGTILLELRHEGTQVKLSVSDQGPGMTLGQVSELFKSKAPDTRLSGRGLGMGLSLCKHYLEIMGGTLVVNTVQGQGATIILILQTAKE